MRFPPSFLDEIKARLPVSEVARRRVKLVKAGREWKGLSPFNHEKTPSFYVNDQKQFFHDFSSGKHGNVFDFVMETEGLSFPEAVERLAQEAGLELPSASPEAARREKQRATLHDVMELTAGWFERQLQAPSASRARAYLDKRALAPPLRAQFRLGYAPAERAGLRDWLAGQGVELDLMIEAGLLVHGEGIASPYDRFRDRVMFPICDRNGRTIAFGGRALDPSAPAKYLNSPETPLFHKGAVLYNHHGARKAAQTSGRVVAVEGYIDVIALAGAGTLEAVAPLGTALTAEQCGLLWTLAEEPVLCFDGDKAGLRAAERALDIALPLVAPGRSLRFAFLPEGMDPDDLIRAQGSAAMAEALAAARPLADVLWKRECEAAGPLDTPDRRAALETRVLAKVQAIGDETLRRHYRDEMKARLGALRPGAAENQRSGSREGRWRPAGPGRRSAPPPRGYVGSKPSVSASLVRTTMFAGRGIPPREASILVLSLTHPELLHRFAEELAELDFSQADLSRLRDALLEASLAGADSTEGLRDHVDARGLDPLRRQVEGAAPLSLAWCARPEASESDVYQVLRQALFLHRKARALHREARDAALALEHDPSEANLSRLREIQSELSGLDGREAVLEGFGESSGRSGAL